MGTWDLHVIVVEAAAEDLLDLLRASYSDAFNEIIATREKREQVIDKVRRHEDAAGKHWRTFEVCPLGPGASAAWFCYRVEHPDDYFGAEAARLSLHAEKDVFYIWERHLDHGHEVYRAGRCVNSVVVSKHAALVTLDGEEMPWKRRHGDPVAQHSQVPAHIRANVRDASNTPGELLLLFDRGITSVDAFLAELEAEP